jgi:hypothetical protein
LSEAELRYVARMLPTIVEVGRTWPTAGVDAVGNTCRHQISAPCPRFVTELTLFLGALSETPIRFD